MNIRTPGAGNLDVFHQCVAPVCIAHTQIIERLPDQKTSCKTGSVIMIGQPGLRIIECKSLDQ